MSAEQIAQLATEWRRLERQASGEYAQVAIGGLGFGGYHATERARDAKLEELRAAIDAEEA